MLSTIAAWLVLFALVSVSYDLLTYDGRIEKIKEELRR